MKYLYKLKQYSIHRELKLPSNDKLWHCESTQFVIYEFMINFILILYVFISIIAYVIHSGLFFVYNDLSFNSNITHPLQQHSRPLLYDRGIHLFTFFKFPFYVISYGFHCSIISFCFLLYLTFSETFLISTN